MGKTKVWGMGVEAEFEIEQARCPCGGVILADTEGWEIPMCFEHYEMYEKGYEVFGICKFDEPVTDPTAFQSAFKELK